ncbi:hypothetical protein [Methylobrevis pamukkalensis]|uniref:Uncharacterized protein n=1 Tax=Methylobrevis pamukkalensis TaxID=1439726 RepID=A0A1E3H1A4_9HYPH|nr:hypothetical protein [Methylobrevis pamukkalensis]ODN70090.1 hypothetical protein A6302_02569 [Methylobrevis pamukkalensis]
MTSRPIILALVVLAVLAVGYGMLSASTPETEDTTGQQPPHSLQNE